jgi:hypothetical protein
MMKLENDSQKNDRKNFVSKQIIILALSLISVGCTLAKPAKIEYLLPAGFTGGVIVLYNQPDGVAPETLDDGTIRYRIPKDGFLMLNTHKKESIISCNCASSTR